MNDLAAFVLVLAAVICFTDGLLFVCAHLGHWARLAAHFPVAEPPPGPARYFESATLGWLGYSNGLTMRLSPAGLYLAMPPFLNFGHRPMLIPWGEMTLTEKRGVLGHWAEASVGVPPIGTLTFRWGIVAEAQRLGYLPNETLPP